MYTKEQIFDYAEKHDLTNDEFEDLLEDIGRENISTPPEPAPTLTVPEEKIQQIPSDSAAKITPPISIDTSQGPVGTNLTGREEFPNDQGGISTELSKTFYDPTTKLWHNFPSITEDGVQLKTDDDVHAKWLADGKIDKATGTDYSQGYKTVEEAEAAARGRSDTIQPSTEDQSLYAKFADVSPDTAGKGLAFDFMPSSKGQPPRDDFGVGQGVDGTQEFFNKIREEEKGTDFQAINPDVTWGEVGDFVHNRFKNFPAMTGKALMDPAIALGDFVGLENKDFMRAAQRYSMSLDEDMAKIREDDPEAIKKAIKESAGKTIPSRYTALGVGIENLAQIAPGLGYGKLGQAAAQSKTVKKLFKAKPEVDPKTGAWQKKQGFSDKASARIGGGTAGLALGSGQIASETRQMTKEYLSGLKNNEGNPLFDDKQIEEFADNVVDKALYISGLPNAALSAYGLGPAFMKTDDGGMKALFKAAMKAGVTDMVFESIQEPFQGAAREEAMRQDIDPSINPLDPSRRTQEALLALGPGFATGSLTSVGSQAIDKGKSSLDTYLAKKKVKTLIKELKEHAERQDTGSLAKPKTFGEAEVEGEKPEEPPSLKDSSVDSMVIRAREGKKEDQEKLEKFGLEWKFEPIVRFVGKDEVDLLIKGEKIEGRRGDKDENNRIDITKDIEGESVAPADINYRIKFKDSFDDKLDSGRQGHRRITMRGSNKLAGWIDGPYDINDVASIEEKQPDGSWKEVSLAAEEVTVEEGKPTGVISISEEARQKKIDWEEKQKKAKEEEEAQRKIKEWDEEVEQKKIKDKKEEEDRQKRIEINKRKAWEEKQKGWDEEQGKTGKEAEDAAAKRKVIQGLKDWNYTQEQIQEFADNPSKIDEKIDYLEGITGAEGGAQELAEVQEELGLLRDLKKLSPRYDKPVEKEPEKTVTEQIKEAVKAGDRNKLINIRGKAEEGEEQKKVEHVMEEATVDDARSTIAKKRERLEELKRKKAAKKPLQSKVEGDDDVFVLSEDQLISEDPEIIALEAEIREETYRELIEKESNVPAQKFRSSVSIEKQQYSTPQPISFLAQELGRAGDASSIYEPTAGTGSLLTVADPKVVTANEIDADRLETLGKAGYKNVTSKDALTEELPVKEKSQDLVIMNPPFGALPNDVHYKGYEIQKKDHLIAVKHLEAMKDSGRAVLIVGANFKKPVGPEDRAELTDADRIFLNYLHNNYNVADNFEIEGKLYARLGATAPIRVIIIAGRRKKNEYAPSEPYYRVTDHDDLYERFQKAHRLSERVHTDTGRRVPSGAGGVDEESTAAGVGVSGVTERGDTSTGERGEDISEGVDRVGGEPDKQGPTAEGAKRGDDDRGIDDDRRGEQQTGRPGDTGEQTAEQGREGTGEGVVGGRENIVEAIRDNALKRKNKKDISPEELLAPYEEVQSEGTSQNANPEPLIPSNMVEGVKNSLKKLVKEVGPLDEFLMKELGYTKAELFESMFAVQIDSVAMAISQMKKGNGFVVGDQTGLGKGRQGAAILRWAKRQGKIPVFVTAKSNLFSPMYQDGLDIKETFKPFLMNNNANSMILDENKRVVHGKLTPKQYASAWKDIEQGKLPKGFDQIFTTYSQFQAKMVGDKSNKKRDRFKKIASNSIFILDEMHNAAGKSNTNSYFMQLLKMSRHNGVAYFSATFAKTPKNLPLLFTTDLSKATDGNIGALVSLLNEGGLPLQRLISSALADAGQLVNRRTSFKGIDVAIKTPDITTKEGKAQAKKETELSDNVTSVIRNIRALNKMILGDVIIYEKELQKEKGVMIRDADGKLQQAFSVSSTNFSAIFHNLVSQFLLATKVEQTVKEAVASHKANEKTIITMQNTMGAFLEQLVIDDGLQDGDQIIDTSIAEKITDPTISSFVSGFTWNRVLDRNINKALTITIKDARNPEATEKILIPEEKLNPLNRAFLEQVRAEVRELDVADLPVSPIDKLRQEMEKAGLKTNEMTGRNWRVDYSEDIPTVHKRTPKEKQKPAIVQDYQDGAIDSIVLNKSGAEGVSLHSKKGTKDQKRRRHTIVMQPNPDINDQVQLMGRGNRVGQINLPKITILTSTLPSEKRPTAILVGKLESLNANTSANSQSALMFDASNIFNQVGDEMIANWIEGNPDIADKAEVGQLKAGDEPGALAKTVTGRMAIMPVEIQEMFWEEIGEAYRSEIDHLNETGDNPLDTQFRDLDAKLKGPEIVLVEETDKDSAFGKAAKVALYDIKKEVQFITPKDADAKVLEAYGITYEEYQKGTKNVEKIRDETINLKAGRALEIAIEKRKELDDLYKIAKESDDKKTMSSLTNRMDKLNQQLEVFQHEIKRHYPGRMWVLNIGGETMTGLVTEVIIPGFDRAGANVFALSQNTVKMVRSDGYPPISLPMSKIKDNNFSHSTDKRTSDKEPIISHKESRSLYEVFSFKPEETKQRQNKYIITENLIRGIGATTVRGKIIDYSDDKGNRLQGIILPKTFDPNTDLRKEKKLTTGASIIEFLDEAKGGYRAVGYLDQKEGITDEIMLIKDEFNQDTGWLRISVSSTKMGAKFHQDKELIAVSGNFYGQKGRLTAKVPKHRAEEVINVILKHGPLYGYTPTTNFKSIQAEVDPPNDGGLYSKLFSRGETKRRGRWTADDPEKGTGAVAGGLEYDYRFDQPTYEPKPFQVVLRRILDAVAGKGRSARPDVIRGLIKEGLGVPISDRLPIRQSNVAGTFSPETGNIRSKNKNRISVTMHELGHYIRFRYPETKRFFSEYNDELMALVPTPYDKDPIDVKIEEGFAEFVRLYLTKRKRAYKDAPRLSIAFAELISKNAPLEAVLEELTALIHEWMGLTGPERIAAKIGEPSFLDKLKNKTMTGLVGHLYSSMNRFVQYIANPRWSIGIVSNTLKTQIEESGGQEATFHASDDPDHIMRLLSGWQLKFEKALYAYSIPFKFSHRRDRTKRGISLREALQPVLDLHDDQLTAEWGYWMVAKRAKELMEDVSDEFPNGRERLFQEAEIKEMLRYYDETYDESTKEAFEEASRRVKIFQDFFVQYAIDGGYLTPEMGDMFRSYMAYIPFHRVKEGQKDLKTGKGSPFMRLYGGTSNIADVIDNIINNTSNIIHAVDTNYVIIKLLELSERVDLGGIIEQVGVPTKHVSESTARVMDRLKAGLKKKTDVDHEYLQDYIETFQKFIEPAMMEELGTMMTFFAPSGKENLGERIIIARRNGKTIGIKFHEEGGTSADRELGDLLYKSVLSMRPEEINWLEKTLYIGARIPRAGIVLSPWFMVKNLARDTLTAFFQSDAMKTFIPFWHTAKGLGRVLASKLVRTPGKREMVKKVLGKKYVDKLQEVSKEWELMEDMGAGYADQWLGQYFGERKYSVANTKQLNVTGKIRHLFRSFIMSPIQGLEKLGSLAETPSRAEIGKHTMDEQMPTPEQEQTLPAEELEKLKDDAAVLSAVAVRKGALDFAQKGTGRVPRFFFRSAMFLNPRVQEIVMLFEKAGVRPSSKTVVRIAGKVFLTTLARWSVPAMGAMWLAIDHEDEEWYKNLPDEAKNLNIHFTKNYHWPNPFSWGTIAVRLPMLWMEQYRATIKSEFGLSPAQMNQFDDAYKKAALYAIGGIPMVTLVEPWIEIMMDEDMFFGFKIEGMWSEYKAKGFVYKQRTSETLKQFGYYHPDSHLSPAQIEFLLRGHFTGFADLALWVADAITSSIMDLPVGPSKPFLKTFYSRPEDKSYDKNTIQVPKKLKELIGVIDAYKTYKKDKATGMMEEYKKEHPLADRDMLKRESVKQRVKRVKELDKKIRKIRNRPNDYHGYEGKTKSEISDIKRVEINKINEKRKKAYGKIQDYLDKHYNREVRKMQQKELEEELAREEPEMELQETE